ncbi:hypothetical protein GCM10011399_17090 [Subtercola lobariae]|uniref:Uncharacterized protein n=1 Tax=Subtercola lobariae TaxID=1588641 RepID=A0A917EYT8_9MICO|nr:hypothetical protein GCM10011399_17090 [Subtercola lobariae]
MRGFTPAEQNRPPSLIEMDRLGRDAAVRNCASMKLREQLSDGCKHRHRFAEPKPGMPSIEQLP